MLTTPCDCCDGELVRTVGDDDVACDCDEHDYDDHTNDVGRLAGERARAVIAIARDAYDPADAALGALADCLCEEMPVRVPVDTLTALLAMLFADSRALDALRVATERIATPVTDDYAALQASARRSALAERAWVAFLQVEGVGPELAARGSFAAADAFLAAERAVTT